MKGWYKMRLIDANRAMEIVRDQRIAHPNAYHLTNYATLILQEAPTVDAAYVLRSMWISVEDRLPDSNGQYIVTACDEGCAAGEGIWYGTVVVTAEYYNGCWTWYEGGHEYDLDGIVTHWMPLPEMPQK